MHSAGRAGPAPSIPPTASRTIPTVTYFDLVKQVVTDLDEPARGMANRRRTPPSPYRHIEGRGCEDRCRPGRSPFNC